MLWETLFHIPTASLAGAHQVSGGNATAWVDPGPLWPGDKGSTEAPGTSPAGPWSPGHRRASLEQRQWGRHLLFIAKGPAQGERKLRRREKRQHRASLRVIIPDTWLCSPPSGSLLIPIKNPLPEASKMPALYGIK